MQAGLPALTGTLLIMKQTSQLSLCSQMPGKHLKSGLTCCPDHLLLLKQRTQQYALECRTSQVVLWSLLAGVQAIAEADVNGVMAMREGCTHWGRTIYRSDPQQL